MSVGSRLFDLFMEPLERAVLRSCRGRYVSKAAGRVLEIGAGTGVNLPYYDPKLVAGLVLSDLELDGSALDRRLRERRRNGSRIGAVECIAADVENLPFSDASFDSVVASLVFCSVPDPARGLAEIQRVLKPGGRYVFIEHVLPERPLAAALARQFSPAWRRMAAGCRLDRCTADLIQAAGLRLQVLERHAGGALIAGIAEKFYKAPTPG